MVKNKEQIILGIDPGTQITGYGILRIGPSSPEVLQFGVIRLDKMDDTYLKLQRIHSRTTQLIEEFLPDEMAIEAPFYAKNVQSMLKLGRAQGVSMAAAIAREVAVTEYAPKKVKTAVTGNGNASKEQVSAMLCKLLGMKQQENQLLDATDALAVALCHHFQTSGQLPAAQKGKGWQDFISRNPGRVKGQ